MAPLNQIKKRNRRQLGARPYKNYSEEMLQLAIDLVKNKNITSYEAERQFCIPRRTIEKRVQNLHSNKPGPHFRLSEEEETKFIKVLIVAGDFGCPLSQLDLKLTIWDYLKKNNKTYIFNNKPPGDWWVKNFLDRHKDQLTLRSTQNITKARAEKTLEEFKEYFQNLEVSLQNVPPTNIINYDETNVSDDPGSTKSIFRRGIKYPERIINHSKGCISLMFAATADGKLLPPYVVYKSEHLWSEWCKDGPEGARYNRSKSGWFDSVVFLDWFKNIIIPWASQLEGPKLVIGDNLSSHLNTDVIELCEAHQIRFAFLPSRSTQITQPLDVAFFGPLKKSWRTILLKYKIENPKQISLNKSHFPILLKQLIEAANLKKQNILSGFKATGIYPFNPYEVYKKLSEYKDDIKYDVDQTLLTYLKENKNPNPITRGKNTKLNIPSGRSVHCSDISRLSTNKSIKTSILKKTADLNSKNPKTEQQIQRIKATIKRPSKNNRALTNKSRKKKPLRGRKFEDSSDSETSCSVPLCDTSSVYDPKDDEDTATDNEDVNEEILNSIHDKAISGDKDMRDTIEKDICNIECDEVLEWHDMEKDNGEIIDNTYQEEIKRDLNMEENVEDIICNEHENFLIGQNTEYSIKETMNDLKCDTVLKKQSIEERNVEIISAIDIDDVPDCYINKDSYKIIEDSIQQDKESKCHEIKKTKKIGKFKGEEKGMKVTILSEIKKTENNQAYFDLSNYGPFKLKSINKHFDLVSSKKLQRKNQAKEIPRSVDKIPVPPLHNITAINTEPTAGCSSKPERNIVSYNINEYILTRYILKKKVEYHVGKIIGKTENKYEVSFYKRIGKNDNIRFLQPKKKDIDTINEEMIVKQVDLMTLNEQETELVFLEDEDLVYFD